MIGTGVGHLFGLDRGFLGGKSYIWLGTAEFHGCIDAPDEILAGCMMQFTFPDESSHYGLPVYNSRFDHKRG